MNHLILPTQQINFQQAKEYIVLKYRAWLTHIVTEIQLGLTYLKDPRIASATIFLANFSILELANRVSHLVGESCFPKKTETQKQIKTIFEITLKVGLTTVGNIGFVKVVNISLHPFIISTIVVVTFIIKYNLEKYLEN